MNVQRPAAAGVQTPLSDQRRPRGRRPSTVAEFAALAALFGASTLATGAAGQGVNPVVIDGNFDDWSQRPTLLVDPADAPDAFADIGRVAIDDDPHWLHLLVDLRRPVTLQQLDGRLQLLLDLDLDERTGMTEHGMAGVDLVVTFTPPNRNRPDRPGMGVGVEWLRGNDRVTLSPYDFELAFAPTTASEMFEMRLSRAVDLGERPSLDGAGLRGRWVLIDDRGEVVDSTDTFRHAYTTRARSYEPPRHSGDPLARARGTAVRVVSWNVEYGAHLTNPDPFVRVLRALRADVLLLQELNAADGPERLHEWLSTHLPERPWSVTVGAAGGNLRTAVASVLPLRELSELDRITYDRDGRSRDVRTASAMVDVGGVPTLFMSVHLKCCGRADGPEDEQRRLEMGAILDAITGVAAYGAPIVVGGDFNLVGARSPMRPLTGEWGLRKADLMHLDARGVATWFDPDSPFTPGRLDYVLFCNASLDRLGGFVLDTRHLAPHWLERHRLERDDVRGASDHFPLVVDLGVRAQTRRDARGRRGAEGDRPRTGGDRP